MPWYQIQIEFKNSRIDPAILKVLHPSESEHDHNPLDSRSRELIDAALKTIVTSVDTITRPSFAYLLKITDLLSDSKAHIVAATPPESEPPLLDDPRFVVYGTFESGMAALLFRINQLGPAGVHEISDDHIIRLFRTS